MTLGISTQSDLADRLARYFDAVAEDRLITEEAERRPPMEMLLRDPLRSLGMLERYENHANRRVRLDALGMCWGVGTSVKERHVRREVTARLVAALRDSDPAIREFAAQWLTVFESLDFYDEAKEKLREAAHEEKKPMLLLAVGAAGMEGEKEWLAKLIEKNPEPDRLAWYARLARARLGVSEEAEFVVNTIAKGGDDVLRRQMDELGYTRHAAAIELLVQCLNRDDVPPHSSDTSTESFASAALGILAGIIPDFPFQPRTEDFIDETGRYAKEEIETARVWMKLNWRRGK